MGNQLTEKIRKEGGGKSASAKEMCSKIRELRRSNALQYAEGQPERLEKLEKDIKENGQMKSVEKIRMLIEIEKIRQTEITSSLPTEQSIKLDDERNAENSRQLMATKLSEEKVS